MSGNLDIRESSDVSHAQYEEPQPRDRDVDAFARSLLQQASHRSSVQIYAKEVTTTNTQLLHEIVSENSTTIGDQQRFGSFDVNASPVGSGQQPSYPCPNCNKIYHYKSSLARHIRLECGKEPQFQCPYCPHLTKHKSSLIMHIDARHRSQKTNI